MQEHPVTIEVPIPGVKPGDPEATATLREPHEVTERYRRPLKNMVVQLNPTRLDAVMNSDEESISALRADIGLTDREAGILNSMGDHVVLAVLAGWTLDLPIPKTVDDVLDLPGPLYDALQEATAEIGAALVGSPGTDVKRTTPEGAPAPAAPVDPFTLNDHTAEDGTSPTEASGA